MNVYIIEEERLEGKGSRLILDDTAYLELDAVRDAAKKYMARVGDWEHAGGAASRWLSRDRKFVLSIETLELIE